MVDRTAKHSDISTIVWAIVPAAGIGTRMDVGKPKQYMSIAGKPLLELTLEALMQFPMIQAVQLCIAHDDHYWADLNIQHDKLLPVVNGGATRAQSVLAGLNALAPIAEDDDWVMVHDAARPCITGGLLSRLVNQLKDHPVGGLLAVPVADTLKRAGNNMEVVQTLERENVWMAQTPQMFRVGLLRDALKTALSQGQAITDESSAIELMGLKPKLVLGDRTNIKVTYPGDEQSVLSFRHKKY